MPSYSGGPNVGRLTPVTKATGLTSELGDAACRRRACSQRRHQTTPIEFENSPPRGPLLGTPTCIPSSMTIPRPEASPLSGNDAAPRYRPGSASSQPH
jgi:hypothetical protein